MNELTKNIIVILCSIVGALIAVSGSSRTSKKDTQEDTRSTTRLESKLDYVSKGVDDIKLDMRDQARQINDVAERVTRVEESTKSAHKRLDELEIKK